MTSKMLRAKLGWARRKGVSEDFPGDGSKKSWDTSRTFYKADGRPVDPFQAIALHTSAGSGLAFWQRSFDDRAAGADLAQPRSPGPVRVPGPTASP